MSTYFQGKSENNLRDWKCSLVAQCLPRKNNFDVSSSICIFFGGTRVWIQDLVLARQAFYHFNPALFALVYFLGRVALFAWAGFGPWSSYLLPAQLDYRYTPLDQLVYWDGGLANFLSRLASNCDPLHLHLLSSWDYGYKPPWPARKCF
jgi:hypothetical protein